jgi:hypothetical protein
VFRTLCSWIGVDRIRTSNQTGRLGRLIVGDRLLWDDLILNVIDRVVVSATETDSTVKLVLEAAWETPIVRYELSVTAQSFPKVSLSGSIRLLDPTKEEDEIEVTDDDITILSQS